MPTVNELISRLEENQARFLVLLGRVPEDEWSRPGPDGAWSIGQIAEHVAVAEVGSVRLITRKLIQEPASREDLEAAARKDDLIEAHQRDGTPRQAPDLVLPSGRWATKAALAEAFSTSRDTVLDLLRTTTLDLRRYVALHPAYGRIDGIQWVVFLSAHVDRHIRQIEDRLAGALPG